MKAKGSVFEYGEYVLCLGFGGLIINTLADKIGTETWLGNSKTRAVAIGFDSGDGILLGSITKTGWHPNAAYQVGQPERRIGRILKSKVLGRRRVTFGVRGEDEWAFTPQTTMFTSHSGIRRLHHSGSGKHGNGSCPRSTR
jgi:hypothetical protein